MNYIKIFFAILVFTLISKTTFSATISGKITDSQLNNLSFATIYVKNTTYGVSADYNGNYFIELKAGTYTLIYSFLGYQPVEKIVTIKEKEKLILDASLTKLDVQITEIQVVSDRKKLGKIIIDKARKNRRTYLTSVNNYKCKSYIKTSIENEYRKNIIDSLKTSKDLNSYLKKEKLNLVEYVAETYYKKPNKFKENIIAYHNYTEEKPPGMVMSVGVEYGEHEIAPQQHHSEDPYIFYKNSTSGNFNFYKNLLNFPVLCEQPIVSPIAANAPLFYRYNFEYSFIQDSVKINKINIIPNNKIDALFYGSIYIEDSTWAVVSVDLSINEKALTLYQNFNIIQNYNKIADSIYLPVRTDITYTIKGDDGKILGNTKIINEDYIVNKEIDAKIFSNEVITYKVDAFDQDSSYWEKNRPITLKTKELNFIQKSDSIQEYYISDEFLDKQDSIFNRISLWTPLFGIGHRNHYTGTEIFLGGLMEQVVPFGVGGYRHKLPLRFNKDLKNGMFWENKINIDYGFVNKDLKGKAGIGLTYLPKKFVRTYIEVGDYYDLINNYASVEQSFSRSNYARNKTFNIRQRIEIFNGLFAELGFTYSKQIPITDMQLSEWSKKLFGELNEPIDFEEYTKTEFTLELKYRIGQKYIIKKNKKIIIGDDFPEINFIYKKGIPNLLASEVNYDYFEIGAKDIMKLARFGESRWQIRAGIFTNKENLRLLEHKYFRGSDSYFFSNPVNSLQLLDVTFNTNNEFLQANYIHHFNGTILNKVPLFKYLKLSLAAGASTLNIPEQNFYHFEMFGGIEKVFRIKKQLFRFGAYAVTADNTISAANTRIKIGISFFNSYTNKWGF